MFVSNDKSNKTLRAFLYLPVPLFSTGSMVPAAEDNPTATCSLHKHTSPSHPLRMGLWNPRIKNKILHQALIKLYFKNKDLFSLNEPMSGRTCPRRSYILASALFSVLCLTLLVLGPVHLRPWPLCLFKNFQDSLTVVDLPGVEV